MKSPTPTPPERRQRRLGQRTNGGKAIRRSGRPWERTGEVLRVDINGRASLHRVGTESALPAQMIANVADTAATHHFSMACEVVPALFLHEHAFAYQ